MKNAISTAAAILAVSAIYSSSDFATNAYNRVSDVWAGYVIDSGGRTLTPEQNCNGAIGGGLIYNVSEEEWRRFLYYTEAVSNNCAEIIADWQSYETNEMVRFTTLNAIVYSGFDNYTNCIENLLSRYEADTNYCGWATMRFLAVPMGTQEGEYLLTNHYAEPAVSNILMRFKTQAENHGDVPIAKICGDMLSGKDKERYDQLKSIGQLWP